MDTKECQVQCFQEMDTSPPKLNKTKCSYASFCTMWANSVSSLQSDLTSSWFNNRWKEALLQWCPLSAWFESESKRKPGSRKDWFFMGFWIIVGSFKNRFLSAHHPLRSVEKKSPHTLHICERVSPLAKVIILSLAIFGAQQIPFVSQGSLFHDLLQSPYNWVGFHPLYTAMKTTVQRSQQHVRLSFKPAQLEHDMSLRKPGWPGTFCKAQSERNGETQAYRLWSDHLSTGLSFRETCSLGIMRRFHQCCSEK